MNRPGPCAARFAPVALLVLSLTAFGGQPAPPAAEKSETEANITRLTASLLERSQFAHHPLDSELAGKFLDGYLDGLDANRSLLLQSDVEEFASLRSNLAQAVRQAGDTAPARAIFKRYLERLEQQTAYLTGLLKTAKFEFKGQDSYSFDRENAQRPRDIEAAKELWRQQLRAEYLQEKLGDTKPDQIASTLTRRHQRQLATMKALRPGEVLEIYLNALAHVYDPHSDYLGREQMESLSISMNLSLFGIGASLESQDGYTRVRELVPGGPAARQGILKPGDRIVAVAQGTKEPVDIVDMPLTRAVQMIRGPKGTTVVLTVVPAGVVDLARRKTISIVRDQINLEDQAAKARILDLPAGKGGAPLRLGVIDLPSFYADMDRHKGGPRHSATADVARLLVKLKTEQVRGVVLDLRRNGGGSLEEAISLTGLFLRKGPVVETRGPTGDVDVGADTDDIVLYDGPLVVLISRFSASASEIVTGALQDYGRAVIVGDSSTFGKGTVQSVVPLAPIMEQNGLPHAYDPGALKVTIRKFYRPGGASTQLKGVASDIVLPSPSDIDEISESSLKNPLPWDSIPAQQFQRLDRVKPYLSSLKEKSDKRVKSEQAFTRFTEDAARVKKSLASKSVSLNEALRRQELATSKQQDKEREKEALKAATSGPVSYEITVKTAGNPGLPAPTAPGKEKPTPAADDEPDAPPGSPHPPRRDLIFNEGMAILADYVDLSHAHAALP